MRKKICKAHDKGWPEEQDKKKKKSRPGCASEKL